MFAKIFAQNFASLYLVLAFLLSVGLGFFLFWRGAKRELIDDQVIFDSFFVFSLGSVFGRITDFFVRSDYFHFSLTKLVFFNAYPGFDFFGAFAGGILAVYFYLRAKKQNFWLILDFASAGIAFGLFFFKALEFLILKFLLKTQGIGWQLVPVFGYLLIYWAIKRFEKKKKHAGFFISFFMIFFSVLNFATLFIARNLEKVQFWYVFLLVVMTFLLFGFNWYFLSKRKLIEDIKEFFAAFLLFVFKTKRVLTNVREADSIAKSIILAPLYLAKGIYFLVKYIGRELFLSFKDMLSAFGL